MPTTSLPIVSTCSVGGCSYNQDHDCHAGAILVTGPDAACGTFVDGAGPAGREGTGQVGACHRSECTHNDALECTAPRVEIGPGADVADCLTFSAS